jgi:cation transport ATPase
MARRARIPNHRNPRTLGETISTLVYLGMAIWLFLEALSLMGQVPAWRVAGLFLSAFLCFLGALRFVIARVWQQYRAGRDQ